MGYVWKRNAHCPPSRGYATVEDCKKNAVWNALVQNKRGKNIAQARTRADNLAVEEIDRLWRSLEAAGWVIERAAS